MDMIDKIIKEAQKIKDTTILDRIEAVEQVIDTNTIVVAKHTETGEMLVIYREVSKDTIYARPYDMFNSLVDQNKYPNVKQKYRFEEIKEPEN